MWLLQRAALQQHDHHRFTFFRTSARSCLLQRGHLRYFHAPSLPTPWGLTKFVTGDISNCSPHCLHRYAYVFVCQRTRNVSTTPMRTNHRIAPITRLMAKRKIAASYDKEHATGKIKRSSLPIRALLLPHMTFVLASRVSGLTPRIRRAIIALNNSAVSTVAQKHNITFVLPSSAGSQPKAVGFACLSLDAIGAAILVHKKAVCLACCIPRQD